MKNLLRPSLEQLAGAMVDISDPALPIEVKLRGDGKVLWANVGPICVLRICQNHLPVNAEGPFMIDLGYRAEHETDC